MKAPREPLLTENRMIYKIKPVWKDYTIRRLHFVLATLLGKISGDTFNNFLELSFCLGIKFGE